MEGSPKRFDDRGLPAAWLTSSSHTWAASLTPAERAAVCAYKLDAYEPINEALRLDYQPDDENAQLIASPDSALARFRLPEPVIA